MVAEALKAKLSEGEAFLFVSPENRRYITDFDASDGYVFVTDKKSVFLTDGRYIEAAEAQAECDEVLLLTKASENLPETAGKLGIKKIYTEAERLTVSNFDFLEKHLGCEVTAERADEEINALRRCKAEYELDRIIRAQRIAEKAFDYILTFIKPGVSEKDVRLALDYFMLKNGADDVSFRTIAISGKNTSKPHGVPTSKLIESGDFVTMDYGALVEGYHSDMTRTVAVGSVTDKQAEVYETVLKAQLKVLDVLKAGVACKAVDSAAREVIGAADYGKYFTHSTGHGVGIEIHESPNLSPRSEAVLAAGDIVTDEPGIYLPGEFGVRIEDMVYITDDGCRNLTKCEKSLIIL